jgi:hypothetical protein
VLEAVLLLVLAAGGAALGAGLGVEEDAALSAFAAAL